MALSISNTIQKQIDPMKIKVSLGWKEQNGFHNFDLDLSAFLLNKDGQVRHDGDFIFYNQLQSQCGSVRHLGDEKDGNDDGDAEVIIIDLASLDQNVVAINICVTIHEAHQFDYSFGMVSEAYLRIFDENTSEEKIYCSLSEDMSTGSNIILAQLLRKKNEWKFELVSRYHEGSLRSLAQEHGVHI